MIKLWGKCVFHDIHLWGNDIINEVCQNSTSSKIIKVEIFMIWLVILQGKTYFLLKHFVMS